MNLHLLRKYYALALFAFMLAGMTQAQFVTPLYVPPLIDSSSYTLTMDREVHNFNINGGDSASLDFDVNTFAFNHVSSEINSYLGPTLVWHKGQPMTLKIKNNLNQPTSSSPGTYNAPTTVHLHGAHVPAWVDGGPHGVIEPGTQRNVNFTVLDDACTLWYHPHGQDETYTQVEMGLAGMMIVKDAADLVDPLLPHRYGIDDFPLVLQDHIWDTVVGVQPTRYNGSIDTCRIQKAPRVVIVNGIVQPILNVPPQMVRFRILDGSSRLGFQFGFGKLNATDSTAYSFKLIGSDGGLLSDSARTVTTLLTGPGIRNEVVFDFGSPAFSPGDTVYLLNQNPSMIANVINANAEGYKQRAFMAFVIDAVQDPPLGIVPPFPPVIPYDDSNPDTTRLKRLLGDGGNGQPATGFSIDQNQFEYDVVNDIVQEGDIEVWTIDNQSSIAHPFHIHDIQFFVTNVVNGLGQQVTPIPVEYLGRKDDIMVPSGWQISFVTKFDDFGRPKPFLPSNLDSAAYMYHCHILTHEDGYYAVIPAPSTCLTAAQRDHHGMMQQFVVWNGQFTSGGEQQIGNSLTLFPNPAHDLIYIRGESPKASEARIFDLQGRLLRTFSFQPFSGEVSMDIGDLSAGMILVEWQSPQGKFTKKVVID